MINDVDDARQRAANAVFGAALAVDSYPGVLDDLFANRLAFKLEARVVLGELVQLFAAEGDLRPGDHDRVAVFAHHTAVNGMVGDAGFPVKHVFEPRGIETGAGAEDVALGQPRQLGDLVGHDVAGIGNIDDDAAKPLAMTFGM